MGSMRRLSTKVVLIGLLIALLIPFPTVVVPVWRVRVVDYLGNPVANIKIREHWCHYSVEREDHEADAVPTLEGYVSFPTRRVWAGLLPRALGPIWNVVTGGVHASFGPKAWIQGWGNGYEGSVRYDIQRDVPSQLVVKRGSP